MLFVLHLLVLSIALFGAPTLSANPGFESDFADLAGWRQVNLADGNPPTTFEAEETGDRTLLKVVSDGSASMLIREDPINIYETPYLSWSWKLVSPLREADLRSIFREDTAVRILVTFRDKPENLPWWLRAWARQQERKHGELPPTSALNYVWATNEHGEEPIKSLYSGRIQFYVMNAGEQGVGEWKTHRVNVVEDYRRAMGTDPPSQAFIAVMGDSDNTDGSCEAWVEYVELSAE